MTYGEFKELGFPNIMPMENVLAQALFDRKIDVSEILNAYYHSLEAERHKLTSQFEEACVCLNMHLSKSWKGENRKKLEKDIVVSKDAANLWAKKYFELEILLKKAEANEQH